MRKCIAHGLSVDQCPPCYKLWLGYLGELCFRYYTAMHTEYIA